MKKSYTFNLLMVFLCVLLLGFVYLNSKIIDQFNTDKQRASAKPANELIQPDVLNEFRD